MKNKITVKAIVLALASAGLASLPMNSALANPTDGKVVAGNAVINNESATKIGIVQTSNRAIVDWKSYSIGTNEHVQYYQPAGGVTLNRVVGEDPSKIFGRMTANGQVFLVNPNGIYFGKNAQIDVAGLVATTHNIRNEDFMAGKYNFDIPGKPGASVINEGTIRIADTGIAAFVAPSVANRGVIVAKLGKVTMAAANGFTLDFHGDQLLTFMVNDEVAKTAFDIDGKQLTSFVENSGRIEAQGGYVLLTAKAAENAIHGVINHSGVIEAQTVDQKNGEIILHAGKGSLVVSGTLDASAPNGGNGGFIETSGGLLAIDPAARISTAAYLGTGKTGKWLLDPLNIVIANAGSDGYSSGTTTVAFGGNAGNTSTIDPSLLNNAKTNVELQATQDITFSNVVAMVNSGVGITAKAGRDIRVNANISTNNGDINLLAGWDQGSNAAGVNSGAIDVNSAIISSGAGNITIIGKGSGSLLDQWHNAQNGVLLHGSALVSSTTGNITIQGRGIGSFGFGVHMEDSALITSSNGDVAVTGFGGTGGGSAGVAVGWDTAGSEISVTGTGGLRIDGTAGDANWSYGVNVVGSISHIGTAGIGKTFEIYGAGGNAGHMSYGISFSSPGKIQTVNTPVSIVGIAGNAGAFDSMGVGTHGYSDIAYIKSTGAGVITIAGSPGGAAGSRRYGISFGGNSWNGETPGYIQATGTKVNLFSDNIYIRNEAVYGPLIRGASSTNAQSYSAYAAYAAEQVAIRAAAKAAADAAAAQAAAKLAADAAASAKAAQDSASAQQAAAAAQVAANQAAIAAQKAQDAAAVALRVKADAEIALQAAESALRNAQYSSEVLQSNVSAAQNTLAIVASMANEAEAQAKMAANSAKNSAQSASEASLAGERVIDKKRISEIVSVIVKPNDIADYLNNDSVNTIKSIDIMGISIYDLLKARTSLTQSRNALLDTLMPAAEQLTEKYPIEETKESLIQKTFNEKSEIIFGITPDPDEGKLSFVTKNLQLTLQFVDTATSFGKLAANALPTKGMKAAIDAVEKAKEFKDALDSLAAANDVLQTVKSFYDIINSDKPDDQMGNAGSFVANFHLMVNSLQKLASENKGQNSLDVMAAVAKLPGAIKKINEENRLINEIDSIPDTPNSTGFYLTLNEKEIFKNKVRFETISASAEALSSACTILGTIPVPGLETLTGPVGDLLGAIKSTSDAVLLNNSIFNHDALASAISSDKNNTQKVTAYTGLIVQTLDYYPIP